MGKHIADTLGAQPVSEKDARRNQTPTEGRRGLHPVPQRRASRQGPGHSRNAGNETDRRSPEASAARRQGSAERGKQNPARDRPAAGALSARVTLLRDLL